MKKVYLETFGCQMNVSDSERVATTLESGGYEMTPDESAADVILFNTCSVREKAEHKLYTRVGQVRHSQKSEKLQISEKTEKTRQDEIEGKSPRKAPLVGVMGCVAQLEGETLFGADRGIDFVLGTRAVGRVGQAIEAALGGERNFADLGEREEDYQWSVSERQRHSPHVAFVPIIEGCNKFCTYCIVPFARGREKSLPAARIVRQVLELRRQGVREIHLIGQNVNSYRPRTAEGLEGFSGATLFSRLLRAVAATGIERIKFTTSFPRDFHPDIVEAIDEHENLCNWVHLPVQSGSDRILRAMRRGHTIDNYKQRVDKIRASSRRIALTTDIIVGFPGETDDDFRATVELARYCLFDTAYLFKYSPRPGTPAFELADDVSETLKTSRFLELEEVIKASQASSLQGLLNQTVEVLAEGFSSRSEDVLNGHTSCHKIVNFTAGRENLGKIVKVKITECKTNTLFGRMI